MIFEVKGKPQGKSRPRFSTHYGKVHTYTPYSTVSYEKTIRNKFLKVGGKLLQGSISVYIEAHFEVPKSYSKQKKERAILNLDRPTSKPDSDNIAKVVCDALNKVAYSDDKNIAELRVVKMYGEEPKIIVNIENL